MLSQIRFPTMARRPLPKMPPFPRPRTFFGLMSLRTGTELIIFTVLINKLSGLYGLLAPLTGFGLSPVQISMYIYSIVALVLTLILAQGMRRGTSHTSRSSSSSSSSSSPSPFATLSFAYLYAADSVINAAYTTVFSIAWFHVLASHPDTSGKLGSTTMGDTAGFTEPEFNASTVEVVAEPASGLTGGQNAVVTGVKDGSGSGAASINPMDSGGIASITVVCLLWTLRVYFVLVVLAYARQVLRSHIATIGRSDYYGQYSSGKGTQTTSPSLSSTTFSAKHSISGPSQSSDPESTGTTASDTTGDANNYTAPATTTPQDPNLAENPFAPYREDGLGWRGSLGRFFLSVGPSYWLGADEEEEWARGLGDRFRRQHLEHLKTHHAASGGKEHSAAYSYQTTATPPTQTQAEVGLAERERRRRSGTGPPAPVDMPRFAGGV